jgi:adenylosuccinate lyase
MSSMDAISPIDGRYQNKTRSLRPYFSDFALVRYRVKVEIEYLLRLARVLGIPNIIENELELKELYLNFDHEDWLQVVGWEDQIHHDVKAVEMYIRDELRNMLSKQSLELIHFGLTSQDISNTAYPLMVKDSIRKVIFQVLNNLLSKLYKHCTSWKDIPMLARTHGQPATPTRLGKEIEVFRRRLLEQLEALNQIPFCAKFGGATGNMNAHHLAFPNIDWNDFANKFIKGLGLQRSFPTTQIEHYDHLANVCHVFIRINNILIDLCRDIWHYISIGYFRLSRDPNQVGSSTMPHKVNPIDFENAEGNLGMANAIFQHLASKLPISRLQRDLTDSTVLRNMGVPFAHSIIAYQNITSGLQKLDVDVDALEKDLNENWAVLTEAIQTILRREGVANGYDLVKYFTINVTPINRETIHQFMDTLPVREEAINELKRLTPSNYLGTG